MKRLLAALLAACSLLSLSACGETAASPEEDPAPPTQEEAAAPEPQLEP